MLPIGIFESKDRIFQNFLYLKGLLLLFLEIAKKICIKSKTNIFAVMFSQCNVQKRETKKKKETGTFQSKPSLLLKLK